MSAPRGRPVPKDDAVLALPDVARAYLLARLDRGWTQAEAARRMGVSQQMLSQIERGMTPIGPVTQADDDVWRDNGEAKRVWPRIEPASRGDRRRSA